MKIAINKVGSRWYNIEIFDDAHWLSSKRLGSIEATRHDGGSWTDYKTTWTLTGLGCRKYKNEVLTELSQRFGDDNKLKIEHEKWIKKWRDKDALV